MDERDTFELLKSLPLFKGVQEPQLRRLCEYLAAAEHPDGDVVFEEGSLGDSLYFISKGHVRIAKKLRSLESAQAAYKELALLGPGDCFGEMALIDKVSRSADAIAQGEAVLFRLGREDLDRWLSANPALALGFFAQLVQVISGRLRRSSNEVTLLYDLSHLLLERTASPKALLEAVMARLMRYLEGEWCSGAYLYNPFNDEMDLVVADRGFLAAKGRIRLDAPPQGNAWLDDSAYQVVFPGKNRVAGFLVFRRSAPLSQDEQNEFARTLTTAARLIASALENIGYRTEEELRSRLCAVRQGEGL
jgi:CRP/FNR family transcriptional regulator, cyclic AMP receptor protein